MPTAQGQGPFSYETLDYNSGNNYALNAGSATAPKTQFDSDNGETLEVYANGVLLEGDGSVASSVDAVAKDPDHGFYVDSLTNPTKVHLVSNISGGQKVLIKRISNRSTPQVDFAPGSVIREQDLDAATNQTLHVAQEAVDIALQGIIVDANDKWDAKSKQIKNVADPTDAQDAATKVYADANVATTLSYKNTTNDYKLESKDWAQKIDGQVKVYTDGSVSGSFIEDSAKNWASGTTSAAPAGGSAKEWAIGGEGTISNKPDGSEYASKEYAQGSVLAAGGSAKNWAQLATTPTTTATDASAKEWATGVSTHKNEGSAKDWAVYTSGDVRGASVGSMSAKEWAVGIQGRGVAGEGSAKDWATRAEDSTVDNAGYSALHWAAKAEDSRIAAANSASAVGQVYDNFSDVYLGSMADSGSQGTNPTTNGTWGKDSSSITVVSATNIKVGQVVTGTGIPTSPKPNVLSIDGTTVVISDAMAAAGSAVALTFTGYGVYGDYNTSKDGPALNNDGDALVSGNLFFNSTDNEMRIYDGANWIAATSAGSTSLLEYKFVTTSTQVSSKTYSGTADVGGTLSYTQDNIIVFMNGVQLKNGTDYTASNGTSIVLTTAAVAGDEIAVIAFKSFTTADMVSKANGGTYAGAVTFSAGLTGAVTGNASTATTLATARAINGVNFDGSAPITVTADANTLSNTTLKSTVVSSSLTSVGTLTAVTVTGAITANGGIETDTNSKVKQKGAFMQSSTHQAWVMGG